MSPETLTVEVKRSPSGRWTATGAEEHGEGESKTEALRALVERIERREAALADLQSSVAAIRAEAKAQGTDTLSEDEIAAEIRAVRRGE